MADETEEIEARLCAYMDGELDEAARAEIERHLASNPRHRQLIEEMSRGRRLLQSLPREAAPMEIEELLHTHLERSVLLDDGSSASAPLRMNRAPQLLAAAAIVILAAGLGLIVWLVVRPPSATPRTVVNLPQGHVAINGPEAVRMETAPLPATAPTAAREAKEAGEPATRPMYSMADTGLSIDKAAQDGGVAGTPWTAASRPAVAQEEAAQVSTAGGTAPMEMGLWVTTDDGPQTDLRLRAFIGMQRLRAEVMNLASLPPWGMCAPWRVVVIRGVDAAQAQALNELLQASAQVEVASLREAAPTTQPLREHAMDLAIVVSTTSAQAQEESMPGEFMDQEMATMPEEAPASRPTTMPSGTDQKVGPP